MKIVWVVLQTMSELNLIYYFLATDSVIGNGPVEIKNFNNATQMSLFDAN